MPRLLLAVALLTIALPRPARADVAVLVIEGRGFGHGVGMAQDGAYWMGRAGASTEEILGHFYPGTGLGRATGNVRVPVHDAGPSPADAVLVFPTGGLVRDAPPHAPARTVDLRVPPGGHVTIHFDGARYRATLGQRSSPQSTASPDSGVARLVAPRTAQTEPLPTTSSTTTTTSTPVPTTAPPTSTTTTSAPASTTTTTAPEAEPAQPPGPSSTRPLWSIPDRGGAIGVPAREHRQYRGAIEATGAGGTLRLVNEVDLEVYLKGMGEVRDPSWPPASLRAQAVAARTYAMRAMGANGEICDTQRCQVYLGAGAEYQAMSKAVDDTRGQVLTFRRALASAVYSANGGGHSASRAEGFGQVEGDYPYLRAAPYPTMDPKPWTAEVALPDVAARLGYAGTLTSVTVTSVGPSGRAQMLELDGTGGRLAHPGLAVAQALRLRSTLFSVRVGQAASAPVPPAGDSVIQAPPEVAVSASSARADAEAGGSDRLPASFTVTAPATTPRHSIAGAALWAGVLLLLVGGATAALSGRRWFRGASGGR